MRITEAKFTRKYNIGNYESEEYSLTAIVDEGEKSTDILAILKSEVASSHSGEAKKDEKEEEVKAPKKSKKKEAPVEVEEDSDEKEEDYTQENPYSSTEEEEETDEPKEEEKPKSKGKKTKSKIQAYARNDQHKEIFSGILKEVAPDWKSTPESKAKAKSVSQKMEGKDFLDENGEVVTAFKSEVKKLMSSKK